MYPDYPGGAERTVSPSCPHGSCEGQPVEERRVQGHRGQVGNMFAGGGRSAVSNATEKASTMLTGDGPLDLAHHLISSSHIPLEVGSKRQVSCQRSGRWEVPEARFKCPGFRFWPTCSLWARTTWILSNDSGLVCPRRTTNPLASHSKHFLTIYFPTSAVLRAWPMWTPVPHKSSRIFYKVWKTG